MIGDCHTIDLLEEVATCLLMGNCRRRFRGGCIAARYLIRRLQAVLPKPYPCLVSGKEISCTLCLSRIISGACKIYEECQSPFFLGLKKVKEKEGAKKEEERAFKYEKVPNDFRVIGEETVNRAAGVKKDEEEISFVRVLIPWEETPEQAARRKKAEKRINNPYSHKQNLCSKSPLPLPRDILPRGYIEDTKGNLKCEKCGKRFRKLYRDEKGYRVCEGCLRQAADSQNQEAAVSQTPKVNEVLGLSPARPHLQPLVEIFSPQRTKSLERLGINSIDEVVDVARNNPEMLVRNFGRVSASGIINKLIRQGIEVEL